MVRQVKLKEFALTRNRQSVRKTGGKRGDPTAEALLCKQVSRSASEAERVWKVASGAWEVCGAKASAEVGRTHSSVEAGQCPRVSPELKASREAMP